MNVFKQTPLNNDFETVIQNVKLIPIIGNESIINAEINKLTAVPLLQNSKEMVCNIYVKFSKRMTLLNSTNKTDEDFSILNLIYFFTDNFNDEILNEFFN